MNFFARILAVSLTLMALLPVGLASAAIVADGVFSSGEWTGANVVSVAYDSLAPLGNFGSPGGTNHVTGYDIYTLGDANYFNVGLLATGPNPTTGVNFANLYFDTNNSVSAGSDVGFEVLNSQAFIPGVPGYFPYTSNTGGIEYGVTAGVIEFRVPWTFFTTDPLGMVFPLAANNVQLRLSQSFGYSVAGGAGYGSERLGTLDVPSAAAAVPEPTTLTIFGLSLFCFAGASLRRRQVC